MFDPDQHRNQHYVPKFWQRRFAGPDGTLWGHRDGIVTRVAAQRLMSEDWLYTTFNHQWTATNVLERVAGRHEQEASAILDRLDTPGGLGTLEEQITLRYFFAFCACRHPDIMRSGHRRTKELAYLLADVHTLGAQEFSDRAKGFGMNATDAATTYALLRQKSSTQLLAEAEQVERLSPQSPALPQQLAIDPETIERVFFSLAQVTIRLLDAPPGHCFVLGDTPFPPQLGQGFTLPLSAGLAMLWAPEGQEPFPDWARLVATPAQVEHSNRQQANQALRVLIGPNRAVLDALFGTGTGR